MAHSGGLCQQHLPDAALRLLCQQQLPNAALRLLCQQRPASNISAATAPTGSSFLMVLRHGVPASNKPHPAEKSTPVWLAIWRTWAGFANSQLRRATIRCTY